MAGRATIAASAERVRRLSTSGLTSTELRFAAVDELKRVVPVDGVFFPTADPATLMFTSAIQVDMPEGSTMDFLDNELRQPDVNKFRDLAAARLPARSLDQATSGERRSSSRYDAIMRPLGLGDELRAAFRTGTSTWGFICLHRIDGTSEASAFNADEIGYVADVAADLAEGLRRAALTEEAAANSADDGPGIVTLSRDLTVVGSTPAGQRWLHDLAEADTPAYRPLPVAMLAVAGALMGMPGAPPTPRLAARTGSGRRVVLHASYLSSGDSEHIAVVIEPASRPELDPRIAAMYQLTPRESETLALLLRGLPSKTIGTTLKISTHTVNDHIKAIYSKTGVSARGELMATVFRDHYLPHGA